MSHKRMKRISPYSEYSKTFAYQDELLKAKLHHDWHAIKHAYLG